MNDIKDDELREVYDAYYANDISKLTDLVIQLIANSRLDITSNQAKTQLQKYVVKNDLTAIVAVAVRLKKAR
jgi:hypothetical protein